MLFMQIHYFKKKWCVEASAVVWCIEDSSQPLMWLLYPLDGAKLKLKELAVAK